MKYAVVKTGGKQYKVSEGDIIEVDRISGKDGKVAFEEVLLLVSDNNIKVGKPFINGVRVEGKILEDIRGEKVRVSKFKSKVRYRRTTGFRAALSRIRIEKIGGITQEKPAKKAIQKKAASKKS